MKSIKLWKSFRADFETNHGPFPAKVGEWAKLDGKIKCCKNGFHGSRKVIDAMRYVNCSIIALVEVQGESDHENDKSAHAEMRILKAYTWTHKDSAELACYAAEQVIRLFEKEYPDDDRPRAAIAAVKKWLKNPTEENRIAADKTAVEVAWAASQCCGWAAWAARAAAWAAMAAEEARAAEAAVWAARAARAAEKESYAKIESYLREKIKKLEVIK